MKQAWMTVMAVAVLGVGLSLQPAVSLAKKGDDHTQIIKPAKDGVAKLIEAIHHIEESIKGTGDAHAKEALQSVNEAKALAEISIAHAEEMQVPAHSPGEALKKKLLTPQRERK